MSSIYSSYQKTLVEQLKEYRKESKMTQKELADNLGCTQADISKYEQGQKRLEFLEVRKICCILGVDFITFVIQFEDLIKEGEQHDT